MKNLGPNGFLPKGFLEPNHQKLEARAILSLLGIARWVTQTSEPITPMLKDIWPHIWSWIIRLLEIKDPEMLALARTASFSIIVCIESEPELRETMASTPGTIATIAKAWGVEARSPPVNGHPASSVVMPASCALNVFVESTRGKCYDAIQLGLGGDPLVVSQHTLDTIQSRGDQKQLNFQALYADLSILHMFGQMNIMPLRSALFSYRGIQAVKIVMVRLLGCPTSDGNTALSCLIIYINYLVVGLQVEHGGAWAYMMFDTPIIRAIIQVYMWNRDEEDKLARSVDALMPYLLYRSVLVRAERAFEAL